jgi:YidC/Oxa1 family membrane protein insertase
MKVVIKNGSDQNINDSAIVKLQNKIIDKSNISFVGPSLYIGKEMIDVSPGDIEKENVYKGHVKWMAIQDRYFIMSLISKDNSELEINLAYDEKSEMIETGILSATGNIPPGSQKEITYGIYAGPKEASALKNIGNDMDKVVDFGMFDVIAKPCLSLMNFIYSNAIKNYGIAIILLTILFKLILWPLGSKSYKSMSDMRKLQPLVTQIRDKYKNDKQKMNEEMMGLYKTYKVNPLSGCLPLIVQMPIFFAFYKMLYQSIELRHAPFFGWITDLSAPDRLFNFNVVIPYFDQPTGIPVLTLLMGASMFLQQKMSPPAGDPVQAKMMMYMPVFMTFIFLNFSSGLVLYWLVNNIVSIIQQYYIMKKYA